MKKSVLFATLLLASVSCFSQVHTGMFEIEASYANVVNSFAPMSLKKSPNLRLDVSYGFTNWLVAGVFYDLSWCSSPISVGDIYDSEIFYEGIFTGHHTQCGLSASFHPITIWLPEFHFIDVYAACELGLDRQAMKYNPPTDISGLNLAPECKFLYGAGIGIAVNPSRHFGFVIERTFDNINKNFNSSGTEAKMLPFYRFGLNIRFNEPKKWRKE